MYIIIAAISGMFQPGMYSINAKLRRAIGSPYRTTMISYTMSLICLLVVMTATGLFHGPLFGALVHEPFWVWINGVIGVIGLTINILIINKLGGMKAVILPLVSQILGGLLIDGLGLFRTTVIPLSASRVIGALLVLLGVGIASFKTTKTANNNKQGSFLSQAIWYVLALASGAITASMTGIYKYMGMVLGSPFRATFVTTVVGCIVLGIICLIPAMNQPFMKARETGKRPWWIYCGGIIGFASAVINVWLTQRLGVGMTLVFCLLGNTIGGSLIDHFGWFGVPQSRFSMKKLIGLIIMMAGAALIRLM